MSACAETWGVGALHRIDDELEHRAEASTESRYRRPGKRL
jgi:hypothetical protein